MHTFYITLKPRYIIYYNILSNSNILRHEQICVCNYKYKITKNAK